MLNSLYQPEWLKGDYCIYLSRYYFKSWENYLMSNHVHNAIEIMYVFKGQCTLEVDGYIYRLISGDFILVDANVPHRIFMQEKERCKMLNIEFGFQQNSDRLPPIGLLLDPHILSSKLLQSQKGHIVFKDNIDIYTLLKPLVYEVDKNSTYSDRMLQLQMAQLLLKIVERYETQTLRKPVKGAVYIQKATRYLHDHYTDKVEMEELAKHLDVHINYLQRIFKEAMGETMTDYLIKLRVERAKELLIHTDLPIIELCLLVGINSRQYFTSIFKKHVGITPREYRKNFTTASSNTFSTN